QNVEEERVLLRLSSAEMDRRAQFVRSGGQCGRQSAAQRDTFLIACRNGDRLAAGDGPRQAQRPLTLTGDGLTRVVDEDQLLLDCLAGMEVVVLAREAARLAAE